MLLEEYKTYNIKTTVSWNRLALESSPDFAGLIVGLSVLEAGSNEISFTETHQITKFAIIEKYGRGDDINLDVESEMRLNAFSVAKLRIDFRKFKIGNSFVTEITHESLAEEKTQKTYAEIQLFLLNGLSEIRKNNPYDYESYSFDLRGFCLILNISKEIYAYNAGLLKERGYINTDLKNGIAIGQLYITSSGINEIQIPSNNTTKRDEKTYIMNQNNIIISGDGNLVNTGDNNTISQTVTIDKGNFEQLKQSLLDSGIEEADIIELGKIIDTDTPTYRTKKFAPKIDSWIDKMTKKAIDGSWQIGIGAAGEFLADLLMKYYGM